MPDNIIEVGAAVDVSGLKDLVTQSDAVSDAYKRLAEAQLQANTASTAASNTLKALSTGELPNVKSVLNDYAKQLQESAQASKEFKAAQEAVRAALNPIPPKLEEVEEETEKTTNNLTQMRYAAQLAAQEIGVRMPRALTSVLISSEAARSVLAAAFSGIAIVGFIELLVQVGSKLKSMTEAAGGWDASAKAMYDDLLKNNAELIKFNNNLEIEKLRLNEIGKGGTDKVKQEITDNSAAVKIWSGELAQAQQRLNQLNGTHLEGSIIGTGPDQIEVFEEVTNKSKATSEELKHWDENVKATNQEVTELTEKIAKAKQVTAPGLGKTLDVDEVKEAISTGEQVLAAKKNLADAQRQLSVDTAHVQLELNKITAERAAEIDRAAFAKERDSTISNLRAREQLILTDTTKTAAEKKAITESTDLAINTAEIKYQDESVKASGAASKKIIDAKKAFQRSINEINNEGEKQAEAGLDKFEKANEAGIDRQVKSMIKGFTEERIASDTALKDEIEQNKLASDQKIELITQDFERGKITQQQEIAAIAKAKEDELALEKLVQQRRWALWEGDVKKQAEIQAQINKVVAQSSVVQAKSVTDGIKAQEQQYKQLFSQIGSSITSNTMDMLKETETVAQGFQKMYQSIVSSILDYYAKKAEKRAEDWLIEQLFGKQKAIANVGQATSNVAVAGTEALASVPWPMNIAALSETEAAGAGLIAEAGVAFYAAGTNFVPMDGLAYLHKGETVIPANKQGSGFSGGDDGGGAHFHFSPVIQAFDNSGVDAVLTKHRNRIKNEVKRIIKRNPSWGR